MPHHKEPPAIPFYDYTRDPQGDAADDGGKPLIDLTQAGRLPPSPLESLLARYDDCTRQLSEPLSPDEKTRWEQQKEHVVHELGNMGVKVQDKPRRPRTRQPCSYEGHAPYGNDKPSI